MNNWCFSLRGGQWDSKKPLTPMGTTRLTSAPDDYTADLQLKQQYQMAVGTLMYGMLGTRPDLAFAVGCVCRFASNPTKEHMAAVDRISAYLRHTLDLRLTYRTRN